MGLGARRSMPPSKLQLLKIDLIVETQNFATLQLDQFSTQNPEKYRIKNKE